MTKRQYNGKLSRKKSTSRAEVAPVRSIADTAARIAEFKANLQKNQKKKAAEQRQKEVQKREAERENRKNLVGVRVVQKNLVYVTGLTPTVREDELLKTLRKPEFFGQYGNIHKISISNRRTTDGQTQSLGIYVTFEKKEDAARCIQAVNGSQNGERTLKAQLGTTKYCSAWLRYEQCTNRQCMFLHELGDEEDSYTRQDLSSMNSIVTQRPLPAAASRSVSRQQGSSSSAQPASQQMTVTASKEGSDNDDTPGLPSTANWARSTQQRSRRGSHATSGAASSPAVSTVLPVTAESVEEAVEARTQEQAAAQAPAPEPSMRAKAAAKPVETKRSSKQDSRDDLVSSLIKAICLGKDAFPFSSSTANIVDQSFPPLFDPRGGEKRRAMRDEEEARLGVDQEEAVDTDEPSEGEPERGGSLALGGEPEDRDQGRQSAGFGSRTGSAQLPIRRAGAEGIFGQPLGANNAHVVSDLGSIGSRNITPQQQSFLRGQGSVLRDGMPPGIGAAQSTLFQGQGHSRQGSRFSFANENASASASVKLAANPRIMAQQSSMMPTAFHNQANTSFYTSSSMPGPPPGLKSTGTPPGVFGGQGFGSGGFGSSTRDSGELLQSLIGRKSAAPGGSQSHDASKREYQLSQFPTQYPYQGGSGAVPSTTSPYHSTLSSPAPPVTGLMASLYGPSQPIGSGAFSDANSAAKHLKQQRKGKKHRHANTSSSGGSALVDLGADPSILRMQQHHAQHQQQSGPNSAGAGSAGQGLFAGQSQGGYSQGMMYNSTYGRW
jgi:CCR4-NOT transcription complex subunit 4